jgi:hypothetical protein
LVNAGRFTETDAWSRVEEDLREAIAGVVWPPGNDRFVIKLAPYLTDRIGNYPEFEPYFSLYGDLEVSLGYLGVAIVEHDETSPEVPLIEKQQTRRRRDAEEDSPE